MASSSEFLLEYASALRGLQRNDKAQINTLSMLAEANQSMAAGIVGVIEQHVLTCPPPAKLPALYLCDSIMKNVGQPFTGAFAAHIADVFGAVWDSTLQDKRASLGRLFGTWKGVLPADVLARVQARMASPAPSAAAAAAAARGSGGGGLAAARATLPPTGLPLQPPAATQPMLLQGYATLQQQQPLPPPQYVTIGPGGATYAVGPPPPLQQQQQQQFVYAAGPPPPPQAYMQVGNALVPVSMGPAPLPPMGPLSWPGLAAPPPPGMVLQGAPPLAPKPMVRLQPQQQQQQQPQAPASPYGPPPPAGGSSRGPSPGPSSGGGATAAAAAALEAAAKVEADRASLQVSELSAAFVKELHPAVVAKLAADSAVTRPRLRDVEFARNRRRTAASGAAVSRTWYLPVDTWVAGTAAGAVDEAAAADPFGDDDDSAGAGGAAGGGGGAGGAGSTGGAGAGGRGATPQPCEPEDPAQPCCAVSGEPFEKFFDEAAEAWLYRGARRVSGDEARRYGVADGALVKLSALAEAALGSGAAAAVAAAASGGGGAAGTGDGGGAGGGDDEAAELVAAAAAAPAAGTSGQQQQQQQQQQEQQHGAAGGAQPTAADTAALASVKLEAAATAGDKRPSAGGLDAGDADEGPAAAKRARTSEQ